MRPDRPDVRVATRPNVEVVDLGNELKENDLKGHEEDCDSGHSNAKVIPTQDDLQQSDLQHSDMATTLEAGPPALAIATVVEAGPADLPVLRGPEHISGQLEGKTGHEMAGQVEGKTGQERGRVEGKTGHEAAITVHQAPQKPTTQRRRVSSRSPPAAKRKRQNWGWLVKVRVWGLTRVSERQESVMSSSSEGAREQSQASALPVLGSSVVECKQETEDACVDSNHFRDRNITLGRSAFAVRQSRSVDLIEVLTEKSEVEGLVDGKHYKKKAEAIIVKAVKDEDRLTVAKSSSCTWVSTQVIARATAGAGATAGAAAGATAGAGASPTKRRVQTLSAMARAGAEAGAGAPPTKRRVQTLSAMARAGAGAPPTKRR